MVRSSWQEAYSLGALLARAAERDPDALAVVLPQERVTYRELEQRSVHLARSLASLGVAKGSHVGILMSNCVAYLEALFAGASLGAVVVPINNRFHPRELRHVIADADLEVLVTGRVDDRDTDYVTRLWEALPALASATTPSSLELAGFPRLRAVVTPTDAAAPGVLGRAEFAALADRTPAAEIVARRVRVAVRDVAVMMYTSGTTRSPVGCPLTHEAIVRTSVVAGRTKFCFQPDDRLWDPLPMFHMSAILPLIGVIDAGCAFLSMTHFEPGQALEMMDAEGATVSFATFPAFTQALLNHPDYHRDRWKQVRLINNVAPPDVLREMQARMPHTVQISAYGCSECSGVTALNDLGDTLEQRCATSGTPFDGIEVGIRDLADRQPLGPGQRGEIVVRGYCLFEGYYKNPEKTAAQIDADGWFYTGDVGELDDAGRISYLGRTKDMLKVGGENVAAIEIESYLGTHPAVAVSAVVGIPDQKYGEVPAAFVELRPGQSVTEDDLLEHCRGGLARFKVPWHIRLVTEWPMSATKIQKFRLQDQLTSELAADRTARIQGTTAVGQGG